MRAITYKCSDYERCNNPNEKNVYFKNDAVYKVVVPKCKYNKFRRTLDKLLSKIFGTKPKCVCCIVEEIKGRKKYG